MGKATYSDEFKEQALCKVYQRNGRTIKAIADELNLPPRKLRSWLESARAKKMTTRADPAKRPEEWPIEARLLALQQSHGLAESELAAWCRAQGISAHHLTRWREDFCDPKRTQSTPPRDEIRELKLENKRLAGELSHLPPSQIVPMLADEGSYLASESTFYRVLREAGQLKHRRAERPAHPRCKPRALSANAPNQLYSGDISYLPSCIKGLYFYLYVFLDIFSRKIVGWQVYAEESADNASDMMKDVCLREGILPGQVTLHSENGSPMKGATLLFTLDMLGIATSLSRPSVSNDNPYSESTFRPLKYRPDYPVKPFDNLLEARDWVEHIEHWYNPVHRHSGIEFVTPAQRHAGLDQALLAQRRRVYTNARAANPTRGSGQLRKWQYVNEVHLNP
ncbi:IS3 family transposase [Candidatus Fukatsuia endosymbiont of Tuberolachnus salignus]|uniref:IS3 family transposase n=1 Tax=Candidatus Fukatsuia endosymbiont of Tuberolachnus salignus TaxID=3077957 RepID=UPI00313CB1B6